MKDVSAGLMGLLPATLLCYFYAKFSSAYFSGGLVAIGLCFLIFYLLQRWHHPAVLILLTLGFPLMFYIFIAVTEPIFLPLFYGTVLLIVVASCLGALIAGDWSWLGVAKNLALFCSVFLLVIAIGRRVELVYVEAGLLAAGAFGITRLSEMDLVSWVFSVPRWLYKGMHKLWY